MSLINSVLGTQQQVQIVQNGTGTVLKLDCSLKEVHARESTPTEFEVESGNTVSDHIIVKPITLEINGIITDTPLKLVNSVLTTVAGKLLPPVGIAGVGAGFALFNAIVGTKKPSQKAFGQLLQFQEERKPVKIITTLKIYENMWIKSINVPREFQSGNAIIFTVQFVKLLLVTPQIVSIAGFANAALSSKEADLGKQETESPILQQFKKGLSDAGGLIGK